MIEVWPTGMDGWMAYRYEYRTPEGDLRYGYAETVDEAHAIVDSTLAGWKGCRVWIEHRGS